MSDRIHEHVDEGDLCEIWWSLCFARVPTPVTVRNLALYLDVSREAMRFALRQYGYLDLIPADGARNP